jgi:hypothetical protein
VVEVHRRISPRPVAEAVAIAAAAVVEEADTAAEAAATPAAAEDIARITKIRVSSLGARRPRWSAGPFFLKSAASWLCLQVDHERH